MSNDRNKNEIIKDTINVFNYEISGEVDRIYVKQDFTEDDLVKIIKALKILRSIK